MKTVMRKQVKSVATLIIWFSLVIPISQSYQGQGQGLEFKVEPDQKNLQNLDEPEDEYLDDDEEIEEFEDDEIPDQNFDSEDSDEAEEAEEAEEEDDEDDDISAEDLTQIVTKLEREADDEEQRGLLPQIFGFLKGALTPGGGKSSEIKPTNQKTGKPQHYEGNKVQNGTEGLIDLPEDLSDNYFQDDVLVDDITAGIEESLFLTGYQDQEGQNSDKNETMESRQLAVYLFQGQYLAEPRLNTFIDGAIRNLATEMKTAVMEPIYFRVLPRGRVVGRAKPIKRFPGPLAGIGGLNTRRRRRKPLRGKKNKVKRRRRRRRRRRRPLRGRRQVEEGRQRRRRRRRKQKPAAAVNQQRRRRRRRQRKPRQGVGGGRVEGLSKVVRDGDAEMQLFGNHTLIRSHMNMGPIELIMQFRTRRGLRRTGATLPRVKIHTVTRVNMDGSEMMDFLLDRPHPEAIQVRGRLFPMAERLAQNIFSRLFAPGSFLVSRIREKSGLAFLSRPGMTVVNGRGV